MTKHDRSADDQARAPSKELCARQDDHAGADRPYHLHHDADAATDLRDAQLDRAELKKSDFSRAQMAKASMVGSDLGQAVLIETDLSEVNLADSNLAGAQFKGAILQGADLSGADLTGAIYRLTSVALPHKIAEKVAAHSLWITDAQEMDRHQNQHVTLFFTETGLAILREAGLEM